VARRLLTTSALTGGESGSTVTLVGPSALPVDTYYGFAIGSQSDHDQLLVEAGETVLVTAGAVVPIAPWTGAPKVRAVRRLLSNYAGLGGIGAQPDQVVANLVGLTSPCELAIRPRRARRSWAFSTSSAGSGDLIVPIGGRRHVLVAATFANALVVTLTGLTIEDGEDKDTAVASSALYVSASGTTLAVHLGGSDHEELYECLRVQWPATAGAKSLRIYAVGEVGG
jgi:hypothetical protein